MSARYTIESRRSGSESRSVHLRVKDASCSLNNTNGLIESLNLIDCTSLTSHDRNDVESQILRVEISGKTERQGLLLSSWYLNIVSSMGEVANNAGGGVTSRCQWLQSGKCASDDSYIYGLGLVVGEAEESLCGVSIYELHAEDL